MVESIISTGLAIGCIYALIGITYNVMYSASRVFSFTAGTLGMLGGVLGSLFITMMSNAMNLLRIDGYIQQILLGVIIIAAIFLDRIRSTRA